MCRSNGDLYMKFSIKFNLIFFGMVLSLNILAGEGAGREEESVNVPIQQQPTLTEQEQRDNQQYRILHNDLFFNERQLSNLNKLRHTHEEEDTKGLNKWTKVKTWWDRRTLFGLKDKGPRAIIENAFNKNLKNFENDFSTNQKLYNIEFTFTSEEQKAFQKLNPQEQLEFINEFQKNLLNILHKKLNEIDEEVQLETQEFNEKLEGGFFTKDINSKVRFYRKGLLKEINELEQELKALDAPGLHSTDQSQRINTLEQSIKIKKRNRNKLATDYAKFDTKMKSNKNKLFELYKQQLINLSHQINPLLPPNRYLRFNIDTEKFEFHNTDISPIPFAPSIAQPARPVTETVVPETPVAPATPQPSPLRYIEPRTDPISAGYSHPSVPETTNENLQ